MVDRVKSKKVHQITVADNVEKDVATWYVRDATGNVMATYEIKPELNSGVITQTEVHLYGNSRLGIWNANRTVANLALNSANSSFVRGSKFFELSNHLGNVLVTVSDRKVAVASAINPNLVDYYLADVVSASDYYPGGMTMPGRSYSSGSGYQYGFNGKRKDNEIYGEGNAYDFGARIQDPRLMRWLSVDPLQADYSGLSPYCYVMNSPLSAVDPDGKLVLFIGGLRLWQGARDQKGGAPLSGTMGGKTAIYKEDVYKYWSSYGKNNSFNNSTSIDNRFMEAIGDENAYYTSGSSTWNSQASDRSADGIKKAEMFHSMVQSGEITLENNESIKIITHSQGGAHGEGFAKQLMSYTGTDGKPLYNIEVIYNITPHQPLDITNPANVRGVQYSHPGDAVASDAPWWLPNGGSEFGRIKNISEFDGREIMGGKDQPECGGANGNRCGHNVTDNGFIFDIPKGQDGYVAPRKDNPVPKTKG